MVEVPASIRLYFQPYYSTPKGLIPISSPEQILPPIPWSPNIQKTIPLVKDIVREGLKLPIASEILVCPFDGIAIIEDDISVLDILLGRRGVGNMSLEKPLRMICFGPCSHKRICSYGRKESNRTLLNGMKNKRCSCNELLNNPYTKTLVKILTVPSYCSGIKYPGGTLPRYVDSKIWLGAITKLSYTKYNDPQNPRKLEKVKSTIPRDFPCESSFLKFPGRCSKSPPPPTTLKTRLAKALHIHIWGRP